MTLKHTTLTAQADDGTSDVSADEWNEDHTISGTNLALQFNNGGSLTEMAGTSWDNTNRSLTLTGATVTTSKPIFDLSQTWNAGAVTFTALKLNVTNTTSAVASKLIDLQVGSASVFYVSPSWNASFTGPALQIGSGNTTSAGFIIGHYTSGYAQIWHTGVTPSATNYILQATSAALVLNADSNLFLANNNNNILGVTSGGVDITSAKFLSWNSDVFLYRDAAAVLAQRNSTTAQNFRIYNTYTDGTNYERAVFDWTTTANTLTIGTQAGGTGTLRAVAFVGDSFTARMANGAEIGLSSSVRILVNSGDSKIYHDSSGTVFRTSGGGSTLFTVDTNANVVCNGAAIATNATDGFLYIPTCAGTPTGTPTAFTGRVAIVYDTTNNKLYVYNGAWKGGTAPGTWS